MSVRDPGAATFPPELLPYFETRGRQRADAVNLALTTLTPFERRLVREAAVMGYVRGVMGDRHREGIPPDAAVLAEVVDACIAMADLYPYLAAASRGKRRRVTKNRRWPGEQA